MRECESIWQLLYPVDEGPKAVQRKQIDSSSRRVLNVWDLESVWTVIRLAENSDRALTYRCYLGASNAVGYHSVESLISALDEDVFTANEVTASSGVQYPSIPKIGTSMYSHGFTRCHIIFEEACFF